jgi:hypothetical protein
MGGWFRLVYSRERSRTDASEHLANACHDIRGQDADGAVLAQAWMQGLQDGCSAIGLFFILSGHGQMSVKA